jgi:hypothetical protein
LVIKEKIVPNLEVKAELIGKKMHRLEIFHNGKFIGEYERSQQKDIERKTREISLASDLLMAIYQKHGEFVVRWDGANLRKSIRVDGSEVSSIPKECWQKPSWE